MTEQKKNRLYLGIIGACVLGTVAVLFLFKGGGGETPVVETTNVSNLPLISDTPRSTTTRSSDPSVVEFVAPPVFPADKRFNTQVFESTKYQSLNNYEVTTVTPEELNREDPFASY